MRDANIAVPADTVAPPTGLAATWLDELDTGSDAAFFTTWLGRQCASIAGAHFGLVLRATAEGLRTAAAWPGARAIPKELSRVAERAANALRPVIAWMRRPDPAG